MDNQTILSPASADVESIMQAGVLAPSADNHHRFKFQRTPEGIGLFVDGDHLDAPFYRRVLDWVSLGAVVENMTIRAMRLGFEAKPRWTYHLSEPGQIVELQVRAGARCDSGLDAAILERHTNRRVVYSGPSLSPADQGAVETLIADIPGARLVFFDSGKARRELLRLIMLAETERFRTRSLHADLFAAVRFDVGWDASATEGLPPGALAVEPGARWAFSQLKYWPLMNLLSYLGVHHALGFRSAYLPCRLAPHCGVITTRLPVGQGGAVSVGQALERIWLWAEGRKLAFQPLAGAALLALPGYDGVPEVTGRHLRDGWKRLTPGELPLMVFRMGRARSIGLRSGRPALSSFVRG